ncbi:unnamed protein product [Knipowitschia caucasica]
MSAFLDFTNSTVTTSDLYTDYNTNYSQYEDLEEPVGGRVALAVFYSVVFVFSLSLNLLVLTVIYMFEKLTTVTNLLLLNLVLSSLLFISSVPFVAVYEFFQDWPFGGPMCKIVSSLYFLGFFSSVLFLTLMTYDRHLAVVYSVTAARLRCRTYALVSCAAVWVVSALACIKPMIVQSLLYLPADERTLCQTDAVKETPALKALGFYVQLLLFFLFPLLLIIYCYMRIVCTVLSSNIVTKFKTLRLIFLIVLLFFICWTPFNVVTLLQQRASTTEEVERWASWGRDIYRFTYLYFCISPIFYTFVGKKFQNYFLLLLVKRFPRLKRHVSVSNSRTTVQTRSTTR